IDNVAWSVLFGGSLAVLVLLYFLRSLRSTLVISLAIPISVIATFALLYFGGVTINLMTLGGLALGVGMMVDSSVVVLENIYRRHSEQHEAPAKAAVRGANEVASAVVAGTITTLVIFLPLLFVRGVAGVLFQELAFVIMFALFCSLLVSLSLVPVLASRFLKGEETAQQRHGLIESLESGYRGLLQLALRHRLATIVLSVSLFAATLLLIPRIGTEFLPPSDEGAVTVTGEMEVGTRLDLMDIQARKLEALVYPEVPEVVSSVVSITPSGTRGSAKARARISLTLTPAIERERSNKAIADDLRTKLEGRIPGMKISTRAPQGQFLLERILATTEGVTVEVRGFDLDILNALARRVSSAVEGIEGVTDVELSRTSGLPQQEILVNRAKIANVGLTVRDVTEAIETAIAGSRAGDFRQAGNAYQILVQLADAEKRSIEEVLDLNLRTPAGELVALRNLVEIGSGEGPVTIERKDQQRIVTVTANLSGRDLGSVATDIMEKLDEIPRPEGYDLLVAGDYEEQQKAFRDLVESLVLALLLVYMVLASQYESLRDPLVVMLSVPLAAIGVLLTLFLTGSTFNLQSGIGVIMLGGIVVNNAILLVNQAGQLRAEQMPVMEALLEAGRRRLRPILMTTLTTILALMPLALGIGEGADAQAPLARAVVGGLAASTLITLVLIPVVYSLFHKDAVKT
ncbi:MAG: efflux RND transporter permease subunit, partial [Gammaproteobacteria bacterium]